MTDINVTPLVDVMLVLLIIFMVTAPLIQSGVKVDLPRAQAQQMEHAEEKLVLKITRDRHILLGDVEIPPGDLEKRLSTKRRSEAKICKRPLPPLRARRADHGRGAPRRSRVARHDHRGGEGASEAVTEKLESNEVPPPRHAMTEAPPPYRSLLEPDPRSGGTAVGFVAALAFHVAVIGAAVYLPSLFDKPQPLRKPVIARLVALGKPRDPALMPRREAPPPPAPAPAPSRPAAPSNPAVKTAPTRKTTATPPRAPSRAELMRQALAGAATRAATDEKPDPDREGSPTGSPEGTATTAEEGDKYFTEVHDAIQENYVVPSVISERERMYLNATVVVYVAEDGSIIKEVLTKPSGNSFFDQSLVLAIQKTGKLPAPPRELQRIARNDGLELNFRP
jgi:TonB family protein